MKTIEQLLVEDAARALPGDGFSARVLGALPAAVPRRSAAWKPALILGSTALGCALAALFAPSGSSVVQGFLDLAALRYFTPGTLGILASAATLAITGAVLAAQD